MANLVEITTEKFWNLRCNTAGQAYALLTPELNGRRLLVGQTVQLNLVAKYGDENITLPIVGVITRIRDKEYKVEVMGGVQ